MEKNEIKYLIDKILQTEKIIDHEYTDLAHGQGAVQDFEPDFIESWIRTKLKELYNLYLTYIEAKNLPTYLQYFKQEFDSVVANDSSIYRTVWLDPDSTEPSLKFLEDLKLFRSPFADFQKNKELISEREKLSDILKETEHILKRINRKGNNETAVYNEILWIIRLYFPTARNGSKSAFINQFTLYKPDIFVPELKTAIEYKLIRKGTNVEQFVDQVRIDANNYIDDSRFDNFIAVLVIDDKAAATEKSIRQCWKEKKFPDNWTLIVVNNFI